ncbi:metal-sensitive transcriptional regulator [Salisediminibacterium halotolerans]|uniref:DNA-binding transcriptional regulator, FrmR family n=1 Tax=Salisediminibacterium halotolerans TaxID=517425 RepID=A0A1H9W615_9BACI|nr:MULTISPECIES: metal-sensitive transcriptional regulator [Salisediminibacterium]RLJ74129.1 DNA-binding FrmR family transcriptional regulator [Actinophytocola xinjiangensis]RPE87778.1 DNA-binding FrmR family transcriptional regulator [Salisediminibacterium halotolerans]TWG34966.1 DNA-binding FrmR family transcriptional regulator [Salisediminibacterium halotolerans]SES29229.1 DNA-binding transcriptional regulator, FrmR family [Salisediminibacterium haloalkalitolerans]GEL07699.1 transcriptional
MDDAKLDIPLSPEKTPVKMRTEEDKKQLVQRLKRVEGQVRGIQKMIDEDRYCVDILVQVSAINAALKKVGFQLLEDHTKGCVTKAVQDGEGDETIEELLKVFQQFTKS